MAFTRRMVTLAAVVAVPVGIAAASYALNEAPEQPRVPPPVRLEATPRPPGSPSPGVIPDGPPRAVPSAAPPPTAVPPATAPPSAAVPSAAGPSATGPSPRTTAPRPGTGAGPAPGRTPARTPTDTVVPAPPVTGDDDDDDLED
ncbi:small hydrophilic protein [Streptomyces sp. NPDC047928]|uniref:small hydrophilic protein n=1 Tax=unclassified Streptomyces TaxID=2593676 RepID=UPI003721AB46